ncbi:serine/threonine-protein kinase ATM isoform X12 [Primulina huaijiensis]|uniref:serine/threonine-protein kinase ATM isoform X12 n=1 Tax=Primulina huaijiensis TaxID=1492673 RepID=UPI003CC7166F
MALRVTSRDIQEIVAKLSSDKAKAREVIKKIDFYWRVCLVSWREGVKLLNTWLETDRSIGFCRYLSDKTSVLKPNEVPHSETWPFLVKILMQCASSEISSSKKRLPKSIFAKTLRIIVQRAQDDGCSGKKNLLLHVAKSLFNHVWDVLKDVPSFQSEYGVILRYLLEVTYYRFHMRKRVYSNLVLLYMEKVETSLSTENFGQINPKEEVFRFTLTLHSLIENPPGDIPDDLRDNIISGFVGIFSHVRDEGKISRKLVECINTYLLKDGPNLGGKSLEIHQAVNHFVFRYWFATHDRSLKDSLICYAKLQVSLTRGVDDGSILLELVDVMSKELDQMITSSTNSPWGEKCGIMTSSQFKVAELAALVFCRVCANTYKSPVTEKRARREHVVVLIKERVMEGKWPWHAALVCLIRNYSTRIRKDHLLFWFDSISANFERIINAATLEHSYDDLFWMLHLLRLSLLMLFTAPNEKSSQKLAFPLNEVDAAFMLLCSIMLSDTKDSYLVPLEIWDLRLFKRTLPTVLMLGNILQVCFVLHLMLLLQENLAAVMVVGKYLNGAHSTVDIVKSMMTMRNIQGDLQDFLYLRQNVLPAVLAILNLKEFTTLNEQFVVLLPAAAYALSTGSTPLLYEASGLLPLLYATEPVEELAKIEESPSDFLECSVEVLAKIDIDSGPKVNLSNYCQNVRLPLNLRDQLLHEMENHVLECIKEVEIDKMLLSEVIYTCALLANFMFCSYSTRIREIPYFFSKLGESLLGFLNHAISIVEKYYNDGLSGCLEWNSIINNIDSTVTSFKSFTSSPFLSNCQEKNIASSGFYFGIVQSSERLLKALAKLYEGCSECRRNSQAKPDFPDLSDAHSVHDPLPLNSRKKLILDMELDMNSGSIDVDRLGIDGSQTTGSSISLVNQKLNFLSIISSFFPILSLSTWEIMFNLREKENDPQVLENFLCILSRHPHWSSCRHILDLVTSMTDVVNSYENLKFPCSFILDGICGLVASLLQSNGVGTQNTVASSFTKRESEECLTSLGDLVTKVFDNSLFDWYDRAKLVNCICNFVLLRPQLAQLVIDKLFMLLRDPDYRVRLCLARRIGVLFQTWDGHSELFQDVCSNFGRKLVSSSGEKIVRAHEVLSAGPQPRPIMETIVITLMHLVLHSEKIEFEAVFMISVVAAIDPSQRELVSAVLDSLSEEACYTNRTKFLEELMGPILFNWVACGVSLVALVEARDIFTSNLEPMNFIKYCCPWLLPALILQEDANGLKWVAKVACQPCAALVKSHFVHIFSVCMAMHCSKKAGWERGSRVLETSILLIVNISEHERDELIKKQMVSIVNHTLSLASSSSDCPLPFFSKDTIACTIQTIVDGFLDSEEHSKSFELVDKINIFRPDRVFMFIVDLHYKIAAAAHHWHKCNHLAGIEVLVNLLGHRAVIPSTFSYLLNLIGQFIGCDCLLDQCCCIISTLLNISRDYPSGETIRVLGEQLQFLVSELVACCIPCGSNKKLSLTTSSRAVLLLQQLTIGADSSMVEYMKELVAFPEFDIFNEIRDFHQKIRQTYSPRVHLLNFVKRPHYVPPRLLLCSLKALHKNIGSSGIFLGDQNDFKDAYWHSENEIFHAAWKLVPLCSLDNTNDLSAMVSDIISKIGIGDPHRVVFHLPGDYSVPVFGIAIGMAETNIHADTGISEEALLVLMRLLKKYLMDDSVEIIDMASQALRGILSTENGQRALMQLDSYERSLIQVHSKGVNLELVQRLIFNLQRKLTAESISIEDSNVWTTLDKTFEAWICPLVYAVIGYCNDLILRLCQDIVLVKSEVAEFLFPYVIVNVAGRMDLDVDLCKLISLKVQENIFIESNASIKSIQIFLHALNELRLCHVTERKSSVVPQKQESSKQTKSPSYGSKLRVASAKMKDQQTTSCRLSVSTLCWEKVYWLSVDYLMAAKSAIKCGSYFSAVLYVEYWCEEHFNSLTLGSPDFSPREMLQSHIEILASAVTQINEPDSLYGIIQSHKLSSQITTFQHEGNWSKALEYLDLQARFELMPQMNGSTYLSSGNSQQPAHAFFSQTEHDTTHKKPYKGLVRSLQQIGCTHVLDVYCQGLTTQRGRLQHDLEFAELQYEAAWRAGNWDFCSLYSCGAAPVSHQPGGHHFNENLHGCLRALQEGEYDEFYTTLRNTKQDLLMSIFHASKESTEYIYSTLVKLQIFYHLGMAWDLRWNSSCEKFDSSSERQKLLSEPVVPSMDQLQTLHKIWIRIFKQAELHMNMLEPFIAFRRVLLQVLNSSDSTAHHLLESASILRKGCRTSQAAAALHEFKYLCSGLGEEYSNLYWLGRLEEAKLLRAQGQHEMAINLADHISQNRQLKEDAADVFRLVGKWLAETRSSNSRTILEKYLKHAVVLAGNNITTEKLSAEKRSQMHFNLAHYADALFRSHEERLNSNEWHVAIRLRKHKTRELEALLKRLKTSKGDKIDYSLKIQELQKQLSMDKGEAEKLQEDRDKFLSTAVEGYKQCLIIGDKYDVQVVFRLVSMWFSLTNKEIAIDSMLSTIKEVQSYKFIPLVYQIASRMGGNKDSLAPKNFQFALVSLVKKMALDHPYHTIFQLLALANGDRIKDKQRSRNSFVVDVDKKVAAEDLLRELSAYHGAVISQMKQMVEIYIKLAELETKSEDTNKKVTLPRELRSIRELELVPVVTSNFPVDQTCQYPKGFFPHFRGLADSVTIMNGINAPKVVECLGSDGMRYRQLAKSGNDDLRQDAVMEQFFGLVNTFLQKNRDTWKRRLRIRTYKVVPFTPSAGVLEWVNGTVPLGEYLIGSSRNGGAHGRYGVGDWTFLKCRQHVTAENNKSRAFLEVCKNFRPVMHYFFLERFRHPADWFDKRLAYTRSVAASSMVGYIVGLGDRHSMNVLIDQSSAEVVHIDLGVAFEQGLMLKTPERVPFRLTRDIIDGMGVTGVEGVFRRCCEETLSVMRTNKEALLTIIEVFIHDPLYKWALSPLKAMQRQKDIDDDLDANLEDSDEDEYEGNKDAARALLRVKQKLDGYEDGEMRSVHGQVQQLIQDAIDPDRLCHMFPGWGAWL